MRLRFFVAASAILAANLAAHADTFNFSFGSSADAFSGSGTLTATDMSAGEYLITGITGTADTGGTINRTIANLLAPGTFPTFSNGGTVSPNDNLLFYPARARLTSTQTAFPSCSAMGRRLICSIRTALLPTTTPSSCVRI